ncbi:MAG: NAD(+)/NADH kinase [Dehalococcoidia bacterium]
MKKIGIHVLPHVQAAHDLGCNLQNALQTRVEEVWITSAWDDKTTQGKIEGTDLLICVGGDGSMLWAARTVIPHPVPILGINMGRLGFLAELGPEEAMAKLNEVLEGSGRIEERTMLKAELSSGEEYHGLNDAVVARSSAGRPVYIDVAVDGRRLGLYRADAVIVATATGSTGYSLSAGGPILYPEARELLITAVAAHLAGPRSVVVDPMAAIELRVSTDRAVLSVDGQVNLPLNSGDTVIVRRSPHTARFLRLADPREHYSILGERLGWGVRDDNPDQDGGGR